MPVKTNRPETNERLRGWMRHTVSRSNCDVSATAGAALHVLAVITAPRVVTAALAQIDTRATCVPALVERAPAHSS
jgi:hypothetical protein